MKRPRLARAVSVVVLALVVAVTLATAACGGSNTTSSGSPSAATSQAVADEGCGARRMAAVVARRQADRLHESLAGVGSSRDLRQER